jgi:hypothetical protein
MQKWKNNHSTSLRHRAVRWYHHYLQHPGHSRLEETMRSVMYWKGIHTAIRRYVKTCQSCQVNKRHSQKYGHLPPKLVMTTPWKVSCVDLIGPYTFKGKDSLSIDFMCLTMINPATSWLEIVELPTVAQPLKTKYKYWQNKCFYGYIILYLIYIILLQYGKFLCT